MVQRRVVVVGDSPDNLHSLCELVRLWDYKVEAAADGKRALALALMGRTDIVITDLGLPDGDALAIIRRVKAGKATTFVVAFSSWKHLEVAARAAGADAFVLKPDVDALKDVLWLPIPVA